jgi:hypothetical protein
MAKAKGDRLHYIGSTLTTEGPMALFKSCVEVEEGDCRMIEKDGDSVSAEESIVGMVPVESSQVKEGQPVYRLKGDGLHFEKVAVKRRKDGSESRSRSGPIHVSTASYRARWQETFGKNGVN